MKVLPLIEFLTRFGLNDIQYFTHRSERSRQEIFLAIGAVIKSQVVKAAANGRYFSLLCDEVSDIAVTEQLVAFIQFVSDGHVHTKFLSIQNLLEHHKSANAYAIVDMITQEIEKDNLKLTSLAGLASDGASVFTGSNNGVGVQLKKKEEEHMKEGSAGVMQQLWCVCHSLALACSGANDCVKYISAVETNLRQLWSLFENSNKKTALYAKAQMTMASLNLNENTKKAVVRKIQKACRTRWLSLGKAVKSLYQDYPAVLATLRVLDNEYHDAAAKDLFMRLNTFKFIAVIYIFNQIIPIVDTVSKTFKKGTITFSHIGRNLAHVK
ncbi:zinc finger MYM-type protein 1-like [Acropora muricata]|uniref:zinc finger MYM-type protein 1-like n=1 Tax=Acropora muricata TaxID=159855 RepID=UPI0034E41E1C